MPIFVTFSYHILLIYFNLEYLNFPCFLGLIFKIIEQLFCKTSIKLVCLMFFHDEIQVSIIVCCHVAYDFDLF